MNERNRLANKTFVGVFLSLISWTSKKLDVNVWMKKKLNLTYLAFGVAAGLELDLLLLQD